MYGLLYEQKLNLCYYNNTDLHIRIGFQAKSVSETQAIVFRCHKILLSIPKHKKL